MRKLAISLKLVRSASVLTMDTLLISFYLQISPNSIYFKCSKFSEMERTLIKKIWHETAEQSAGGVYAHVEVGMNDWVCTQHEPDLTKYESCLKSS